MTQQKETRPGACLLFFIVADCFVVTEFERKESVPEEASNRSHGLKSQTLRYYWYWISLESYNGDCDSTP